MTTWCRRDAERPERCATHDQDWDFCLVYTPPGTWSDEDAVIHLGASQPNRDEGANEADRG
jgi:hypothetical protein